MTKIQKTFVFFFVLYLAIPLLVTVGYGFFVEWNLIPKGFTFKYLKNVYAGGELIWLPLLRTLATSIGAVIVSMFVLMLAILGTTYFPKCEKTLAFITKLPFGIQGILLATSLIALFGNNAHVPRLALLFGAYVVVIFPYMYQGIYAALNTVSMREILESAEILGANRPRAFFTLVLPGAKRGIFATGLLCTGILFGDFVLVNILLGSSFETLSILMKRTMAYSGHEASIISASLFSLLCLLTFAVGRLEKPKKIKKEK